jgi:hypothetical protein
MIGVVSKKGEEEAVREFFELFKVPWEFYKEDGKYSVAILTQESTQRLDAKLILFYTSTKIKFDDENKINVTFLPESQALLKCAETQFPVYGKISTFDTPTETVIKLKTIAGHVAAIEISHNERKFIRVGFDLFQEIQFLLSSGQPEEFSQIPTLDVHISILRDWILQSGIPLVEIPPVPAGYRFTCCLTHDIDFAGIRRHKFDQTIMGFLYRALFVSLRKALTGKGSWGKAFKNWKASFLLPAVYMGMADDFWMQFNHYRVIEEGLRSTFFIIPFKNRAGHHKGKMELRRATRYDIFDVKGEVQHLQSSGCEIGVHGIDAWQDVEKGRSERKRICEATGSSASEMGIRMHWLYVNDQTPKILEEAGFSFDSTLGYNGAVGYRSGTAQVYQPIGVKKLLELPLNVQDTALFFPDRMGLCEKTAWELINMLLDNTDKYGGVLTINWHDRSLAPERLWGDIYIRLVDKLRTSNVWIDTASRVVRWFELRRAVVFEDVNFLKNSVKLNIVGKCDDDLPSLILRIHEPKTGALTDGDSGAVKEKHQDIHFANVLNTEIALSCH